MILANGGDGFRTSRLTVTDWASQLDDAASRRRLQVELAHVLSPEVLRYLPEPLQLGDGNQPIDDWIKARAAESVVLTIRDNANRQLAGLVIYARIVKPDAPASIHLGYLLAKSAWGRGYASEVIAGFIDHVGRTADHRTMVLGGVDRDNGASAKALIKNGFERSEELSGPYVDMFVLSVTPQNRS